MSKLDAGPEYQRMEDGLNALMEDTPKPPRNKMPVIPHELQRFRAQSGPTNHYFKELLSVLKAEYDFHNEVTRYTRSVIAAMTPIKLVMAQFRKMQRRNAELTEEVAELRLQKETAPVATTEPLNAPLIDEEREELGRLRAQVPQLLDRLATRDEKASARTIGSQASTPASETARPVSIGPRLAFWDAVDAKDVKDKLPLIKKAFPVLEGIGDFARLYLEGRLILTASAERQTVESRYKEPELLFFSLLVLAYEYRDLCLAETSQRRSAENAFNTKVKGLGLTKGFSAKKKTVTAHGDEYMVHHEGAVYRMDMKLKRGVSRDGEHCFRCYFTFDKNTQQVIVGSLPRHLSNNLSN